MKRALILAALALAACSSGKGSTHGGGGADGGGGAPGAGSAGSGGGTTTGAGSGGGTTTGAGSGGGTTTDGGAGSYPTTPPAMICGVASILDGPSTPPAGAVVVKTTDDLPSLVDSSPPGTTFYLAGGVHKLGTGAYDQVTPQDGDSFIGAPGAIIDGQGINNYAFSGGAKDVTISHLTISNFVAPMNEGVVNHDSADGWTVDSSSLINNKGAAIMLGSNNTVRNSCLSNNGQYGFNAFKCATADYSNFPASCQNQGPGTGTTINDVTLEHNEIGGNNTDDWETKMPGCGCTGGGKFWDVNGGVVRGNWVHDNKSVGLWADTNNRNFEFTGNYIEANDDSGIIYEISYNALIKSNTFKRNALVTGPLDSFPTAAIYLSESGGDPIAGGTGTFDVTDNLFVDNWGGVTLWENADRFCSSPDNTSDGYCTLYFASGYDMSSCTQSTISNNLAKCRWKTQNVLVANNQFQFDKQAIGCSSNLCGRNALLSDYGTDPSWSPYMGTVVQDAITMTQNNLFRENTYVGPWSFTPYDMGTIVPFSAWQAAPYNQDPGSTLSP